MAKKDELRYESDPTFNGVEIDEPSRGNSYIGIRKVRWQPDADFKIDLRRYVIRTDGEEYPSKGISMDDETADKVTEGLVKVGYGKTDELIKSLSSRGDFEEGLANLSTEDGTKKFAKEFLDDLLNAENVEVKEF